MVKSDKWFRWCFNFFIFLMCFQLGGLLYVKSLYSQAEQALKDNEAVVDFQCGDFDNDKSYWEIKNKATERNQLCQESFCPDSFWVNGNDQAEDLHVLSVVKPQGTHYVDGEVRYGHFVDVKITKSQKPMTIALVSQSMMQWNLKPEEGARIKEVIVLGSELVWVEGLPEDVKLTYFPKEKLCAFPSGWEELANSENQFRRMWMALKEYTKKEVTSFQGKGVGRELRVPFVNPLGEESERSISSVGSVHKLSLGVHWQRRDKNLVAESFHYLKAGERKKIEVPEKTIGGLYDEAQDQVLLISNFQFGKWDWKNNSFKPIHVDLKSPALYWPMALAFNKVSREVYIYNDDRGGEIFSYNLNTKKWKLLVKDVGYSFVALTYNPMKQVLFGTRLQGSKIVEIVEIKSSGKHKVVAFDKAFDFAKNRWRVQLVSEPNEMWLKVVHPAHPGGDVYPLSQGKM